MLYSYRAVDFEGKPVKGERDAGSERELAEMLHRDGFLLLEALARDAAPRRFGIGGELPNLFRRVTLVDRMFFARNLAVMIGAGLALTRALEALAEQTENPRFRTIITSLRDGIVKGRSLAESLKPHERVFGALFVNMVESGEVSGNLEQVLKILARQMQRDHELRSRVRGAMIYPAIVVFALVAIGILMMIYVVPTLTQTFQELEIDLPLTTRIIIGSSSFLISYWWAIALAAALAAIGCMRFARPPGGRRAFDAAFLRVPLLGPLVKKLNSARFARILSSLISSGIPITRSLELTSSVLGNVHFRESLAVAAVEIQRGRQLSEILKLHPNLFPAMVTQMIQVGEETGTTSRMLLRLALFYEEEVAAITKNLSSVIEPVLMIAIGGIVGFFAVSMIQPIYGGLGSL